MSHSRGGLAVYFVVFAALLLLLALTVEVARHDLGRWNFVAAGGLSVTADTPQWALTAAQEATGYAASVIGCDAEAGIERVLPQDQTPDGRPGVSLLLFAFNRDALAKATVNRVGQCILTCAT